MKHFRIPCLLNAMYVNEHEVRHQLTLHLVNAAVLKPPYLLLLLSARILLFRFGGKNPTFVIRLQLSHLLENMIYGYGGLKTAAEC